ncbi:hypothetical protein BDY24DRAFT_381325 [Mrakia frigida]|uniref:uncharacterized protein n=1 Tax=Mrakia frigida TaxID=29902 RepID=UPI003FCC269F
MKVGAFTSSIKVGGQSLEELDVKVDGSTATCYIEAKETQNFAICWSEDSHVPHGDTEGRVFLDGAGKSLLTARLYERKRSSTRDSVNAGPGQARLLSFGTITTTEDEDISIASTSTSELGTITIKLFRGIRGQPKAPSKEHRDFTGSVAGTVHNEVQAKKSKASFVTTLGELVSRNTVNVKFDSTDLPNSPFVTFKFIYRSHSVLQALGFIPPDSPVQRPQALPSAAAGPSRPRAAQRPSQIIDIPSSDDDNDKDLDTQEVEEAKEQLRLAQQKAAQDRSQGKRDSTAADLDDVKPDIKPKIRKSQLEDQGVIDLTGD